MEIASESFPLPFWPGTKPGVLSTSVHGDQACAWSGRGDEAAARIPDGNPPRHLLIGKHRHLFLSLLIWSSCRPSRTLDGFLIRRFLGVGVGAQFHRWVCGLCAEAVGDKIRRCCSGAASTRRPQRRQAGRFSEAPVCSGVAGPEGGSGARGAPMWQMPEPRRPHDAGWRAARSAAAAMIAAISFG